MPLDHYVTLGRSGLCVSPFCLGAMTFGDDWGWGASVAESKAMIDRYLDAGGNFIDTANMYTKGHSETILGEHLGSVPSKRRRMVIATKFFGNLFPGDPNAGGTSRKCIAASCEDSLRRLKTDYIDLYWMHCWDPITPIDESVRALDDLVASGKVRYVGFSDTPAWKVAEAQVTARFRGWSPVIALQIEYSLLERTVEGELIPMALEMGLGVTPWSPLRFGVLTGKHTRESVKKTPPGRGDWVLSSLDDRAFSVLDVVKRVAKEAGAKPAQVALAWVQGRPGVASTILGAKSAAQLEENLAALDLTLSPEHRAALDEASEPSLDFPAAFIRRSGVFSHGGMTINGTTWPVLPNAPKGDEDRY
jgi:aryl-alcohol dehydrogenase-like predicted oxidoreductase